MLFWSSLNLSGGVDRSALLCPLEVGLGIVAQVMGAVAVVVPLILVVAWPPSAVQSQQPIFHFD